MAVLAMMYHNTRPVVVPSERTFPLLFDVTPDADGGRSYRCKACGWGGSQPPPTVAAPRGVIRGPWFRIPDAHVCPEEGRHRCTCRVTFFVEGIRRFYVDGDDPTCPVHGGGDPYADGWSEAVAPSRKKADR